MLLSLIKNKRVPRCTRWDMNMNIKNIMMSVMNWRWWRRVKEIKYFLCEIWKKVVYSRRHIIKYTLFTHVKWLEICEWMSDCSSTFSTNLSNRFLPCKSEAFYVISILHLLTQTQVNFSRLMNVNEMSERDGH